LAATALKTARAAACRQESHLVRVRRDTTDGHRSDERLVYSNDGLIYYTPDNHRSFEQLYK
jgi:hypothetical protein